MATKKTISKVKDEIVKKEVKKNAVNKQLPKFDKELFEKVMAESKLPVTFTDDDFKLGDGELDIRKLSKDNLIQVAFRLLSTTVGLQKEMATILLDMERLYMLMLVKMGVKDIDQELGDLLKELTEKANRNRA